MPRQTTQSGVRILRAPGKPLQFGVSYVTVEINGHKGTMYVDTGAFTSVIYKDRVKNLEREFYRYQSYEFADAAGKRQDAYGLIIQNLIINADYHVSTGTHFTVADVAERNRKMLEKGLTPSRDGLGALGLDFLVDHNAIIDVGNSMLYLRFR